MHIANGTAGGMQLPLNMQNKSPSTGTGSAFAETMPQEQSGGNTAVQRGTQSVQPAAQGALNTLQQSTAAGKDFSLLNSTSGLNLNALAMQQSIRAAAAQSTLNPSLFMQSTVLMKLLGEADRRIRATQDAARHSLTAAQTAVAEEQTGIILIAVFEQFEKLAAESKKIALSRFFKKGPEGDEAHDKNTDDEYASAYASEDNETDYIRRNKRITAEMMFHYNMLK